MGRNVLGRYENSVYIEKNEWSPSSLHVDALSAAGRVVQRPCKSRRPQFSAAGRGRADVPLFSQVDAGARTYTLTLSQGPLST